MQTRVFHIGYCPELKEATLHYWGCNFKCKGCSCQKAIWDWMLEKYLTERDAEPGGLAAPPEHFLDFGEVMNILSRLELKRVLHMGQEAMLDPAQPILAKEIHRQFGCKNVLLTNGFEMPDLTHIDKVEFGIKAISEELHRDYTGHPNKTVLENFAKIHDSGVNMIVESVFIPGYIDMAETERIVKFIASVDKNIIYVLLPYFKSGDNPWRRPTPKEMEAAATMAKRHLSNVYFFRGNEELQYKVVSIFPEGVGSTSNPKEVPFNSIENVLVGVG
ncbi:MAG: radical SAM protein [Dehalogenimonas sp.]